MRRSGSSLPAPLMWTLAAIAQAVAASGGCLAAEDPVPAPAAASPNPLADIPLDALVQTRERPVFLPSRRAPPAVSPQEAEVAALPQATAPEQGPGMTLLGFVRSSQQGSFAILSDDADKSIFHLRVGESRRGWTLRSISPSGVVLAKPTQAVTVTYPQPGKRPAVAE